MSFGGKCSNGQACASCKYQRRKCDSNCMLAPYFPPNQTDQFLSVHKLFGVSNIQKMLSNLLPHERPEVIRSIVYQANARKRDPVHGCLGIIKTLQAKVELLEKELQMIRNQIFYRQQLQQQQQQQQQHLLSSSQFYQSPQPMMNAPLLAPPPPLFHGFEDRGPYEPIADFHDRQAFVDCKEALDESSAESSLREVPEIGQGQDHEMKHAPGMSTLKKCHP